MSDFASRRAFLRGRPGSVKAALRPPWATTESRFLATCTRCGDCRGVCPGGVIRLPGGVGSPEVDFSAGECTFCGACVEACRPGALQRQPGESPWSAKAVIGDQCLARRRVECRICADQCEARAISFLLQAGTVAAPRAHPAHCTGCGACVAPCPANAIAVLSDAQR
ncbi:MAG: ferredoxin-type protein NapF [Dokdonella sp.]|nr:MAG: ferredoxin-type protein NapF [Dokdonella sp.]